MQRVLISLLGLNQETIAELLQLSFINGIGRHNPECTSDRWPEVVALWAQLVPL